MNDQAKRGAAPWIKAVEFAVLAVILVLVVRYLWIQFQHLDPASLHFRVGRILGALGIVIIDYLLTAVVVGGYFGALGHRLGARASVALALIPGLGKYVPGKIHSALGLVWLANRLLKIPPRVAVSVAMLMYVQAAVVSIVASALLAPFSTLDPVWTWALGGMAITGLVTIHPAWCLVPINWLLRKLKRQPVSGRVAYGRVLLLTAVVVVQTLVAAWAFVLLASGLVDLPPGCEGHVALSFVLATLLGFVAVFAPAGIGVQEGALVLLLVPVLPPGQAAMLAVAGRIWHTLMVLAGAGIGGLSLIGWRPEKQPSKNGEQ